MKSIYFSIKTDYSFFDGAKIVISAKFYNQNYFNGVKK